MKINSYYAAGITMFYLSNKQGHVMLFKKSLLTAITLGSLVSLPAFAVNNQNQITLTGTISAVTCEVVLNGGQSTLNVGNHPSTAFVANKQLGDTALNIALTGCDKASATEKGNLLVSGTVSSANTGLFVNDTQETVGFMLSDDKKQPITNNTPVPLDVKSGANIYSMTVGMGSLTAAPKNGVYSAPILIAYISD